ncbi:hypothetical protein FQV27_12595 [Paracoccus aurantiacus]|uniref:Uncharacterized protein n=1 Tax=Paracoccus aurantiacus TaxID=2599412 RepID=A0A5C6RZK5_9RHOB|nr:hypothetical protein [Paracoccus aurantiacus]TXB68026.1 hypothetical protein FQV27_12595 [Paracoccus aurantiacus]
MNRLFVAALAAATALGATGKEVRADAKVSVPIPNLEGISDANAEKLLSALAQINVITSNCPDYRISDGEWTLLTGTGDMLAAKLGIDPETYDREYYGPAFRMLDDPAACDRIGPKARPIIDDLIEMGGGTGENGS